MEFFKNIKDKAASFIGEIIINNKIERYGTMVDLKIDTEKNKIFLRILLKGETEPIDIIVNNYSFIKEEGNNFIEIKGTNVSREWMNLLAEDYLKVKKFKLPDGIAATILKMIL